jgi:hypothetical protein
MAKSRRRKSKKAAEVEQIKLQPPKSPAVFLFFWLAVPMAMMIGYSLYIRG